MSTIDKRLKKVAAAYIVLDYFILPSGDYIEFSCKVLSNRPWFQITHDSGYNVSSYYDGDSMERAIYLYGELLLAFKRTGGSEKLRQIKQIIPKRIEELFIENKRSNYDDLYNAIKRDTLFLGINSF